jgi:hypothetical protein
MNTLPTECVLYIYMCLKMRDGLHLSVCSKRLRTIFQQSHELWDEYMRRCEWRYETLGHPLDEERMSILWQRNSLREAHTSRHKLQDLMDGRIYLYLLKEKETDNEGNTLWKFHSTLCRSVYFYQVLEEERRKYDCWTSEEIFSLGPTKEPNVMLFLLNEVVGVHFLQMCNRLAPLLASCPDLFTRNPRREGSPLWSSLTYQIYLMLIVLMVMARFHSIPCTFIQRWVPGLGEIPDAIACAQDMSTLFYNRICRCFHLKPREEGQKQPKKKVKHW